MESRSRACGIRLLFHVVHGCHGVCEGNAVPYLTPLELDTPREHRAILYVDREEGPPSPYQSQNEIMGLHIVLLEGEALNRRRGKILPKMKKGVVIPWHFGPNIFEATP
jgi:hypothetical protein